MKTVTILDRSGLRQLPDMQLGKALQSAEKETAYLEALLNSTGEKLSDGDVERKYRRIKELNAYTKNIKNEQRDRLNEI